MIKLIPAKIIESLPFTADSDHWEPVLPGDYMPGVLSDISLYTLN